MKLLFLDIDGVLNGHEQHANYYRGIGQGQAAWLNRLLADVPDLKLVISSAWRYMILGGSMTLEGFTNMLLTHGVNCYGRIHGHTGPDISGDGQHDGRETLIRRYVEHHQPERWAVVDDLPLAMPCFVRTDGTVGLTKENIDSLKWLLGVEVPA